MLSKNIAIPLLLITFAGAILAYQTPAIRIYLIIPVILLSILYVFHPQIDWWWYQKYPPKMDKQGIAFLAQFSPFFNQLSNEQKERYLSRTEMIQLAKDFKAPEADNKVPHDAKLIFGATQAQLTFGLDEYLLKDYETVIIYPEAFLSPQYPEAFHASEVFEEERTKGYILSLDHLLPGYMEADQYYNIVMHEQAQSLVKSHPNWPWPLVDENIWPKLAKVSSFPTTELLKTINRPDFEALAAAITHFMVFPERFKQVLPELYKQLNLLLKVYNH